MYRSVMKNMHLLFGNHRAKAWLLLLLLGGWGWQARAQSLAFTSLDDLLQYADAHSAVVKIADAQTDLARLQQLAAVANTVNLRGTASLSMTDNYALPVSFLPAEIFGGPAGTFKQVKFGQQFVNVGSILPQLDVLSPNTWARVGSARTSTALTEVTNTLNRRTQQENIATAFFNYHSAVAQREFARQNLASADTIVEIVRQRYSAGIARPQDLNNALVNKTNLEEFLQQLEAKCASSILTIKGLIGMAADEELTAKAAPLITWTDVPEGTATSRLQMQQSLLQAQLQRSELLATRLNFMPTLSVVASFNWQQNSNASLFNSAEWIRSRYIGLRLSVPLPTETKLWSQAEEFRINLKMKEINADQMALQETLQNQQLDLELDRALKSVENARLVANLKYENYVRSKANYQEGILPLDQLLLAFTDVLNARLSQYAGEWNLELQKTRLLLNQSQP